MESVSPPIAASVVTDRKISPPTRSLTALPTTWLRCWPMAAPALAPSTQAAIFIAPERVDLVRLPTVLWNKRFILRLPLVDVAVPTG
jgi:hypothetical protein